MSGVVADLTNPAGLFGHLSYIFLIASMMMTSLRYLRVLALLSGLAAMTHFMLLTEDNISLAWETIFTLTNAVQLALLIFHSRRLVLTEAERALVVDAFGFQDASEQRELLEHVEWRTVQPGELLMEQGTFDPPLIFIASGAAGIEHDGNLVGVCGRGDFLGEMSLISGNSASATVRTNNTMTICQFDRERFKTLIENSEKTRVAISDAFNRGLAAKILRMNQASG